MPSKAQNTGETAMDESFVIPANINPMVAIKAAIPVRVNKL